MVYTKVVRTYEKHNKYMYDIEDLSTNKVLSISEEDLINAMKEGLVVINRQLIDNKKIRVVELDELSLAEGISKNKTSLIDEMVSRLRKVDNTLVVVSCNENKCVLKQPNTLETKVYTEVLIEDYYKDGAFNVEITVHLNLESYENFDLTKNFIVRTAIYKDNTSEYEKVTSTYMSLSRPSLTSDIIKILECYKDRNLRVNEINTYEELEESLAALADTYDLKESNFNHALCIYLREELNNLMNSIELVSKALSLASLEYLSEKPKISFKNFISMKILELVLLGNVKIPVGKISKELNEYYKAIDLNITQYDYMLEAIKEM